MAYIITRDQQNITVTFKDRGRVLMECFENLGLPDVDSLGKSNSKDLYIFGLGRYIPSFGKVPFMQFWSEFGRLVKVYKHMTDINSGQYSTLVNRVGMITYNQHKIIVEATNQYNSVELIYDNYGVYSLNLNHYYGKHLDYDTIKPYVLGRKLLRHRGYECMVDYASALTDASLKLFIE